MGANIEGAGTDIITINGVDNLKLVKNHEVMPDRIEAGTFMGAAALNQGDLTINNCKFEHLGALSGKLIQTGAEVIKTENGIRVVGVRNYHIG